MTEVHEGQCAQCMKPEFMCSCEPVSVNPQSEFEEWHRSRQEERRRAAEYHYRESLVTEHGDYDVEGLRVISVNLKDPIAIPGTRILAPSADDIGDPDLAGEYQWQMEVTGDKQVLDQLASYGIYVSPGGVARLRKDCTGASGGQKDPVRVFGDFPRPGDIVDVVINVYVKKDWIPVSELDEVYMIEQNAVNKISSWRP